MKPVALLAGGGGTLGRSLTAALLNRGWTVIAAGRDRPRLATELAGLDVELREVELTDPKAVAALAEACPSVDAVLHLAGRLDLGVLSETSPEVFESSWRVNTFGPFLVAHTFAPKMVANGGGNLVFFGATASRRGTPRTPAFAAAKHGLRGLAEALAKELGPRNVHVSHLVIDGKIAGDRTRGRFPDVDEARCLRPEAVASTVIGLLEQPPSAWTFELDLRPAEERW